MRGLTGDPGDIITKEPIHGDKGELGEDGDQGLMGEWGAFGEPGDSGIYGDSGRFGYKVRIKFYANYLTTFFLMTFKFLKGTKRRLR